MTTTVTSAASTTHVVRWAVPPARTGRALSQPNPQASRHSPPNDYQFGSSHPGVVQFVFCDGAVKGIRFSVDPTCFATPQNTRSGQPYGPDQL